MSVEANCNRFSHLLSRIMNLKPYCMESQNFHTWMWKMLGMSYNDSDVLLLTVIYFISLLLLQVTID